ncbi:hypothetical protein [Aquisphaera insulae]|uniref:hypothetical protein n=1 Tax=Aquisphaera insulae TaxID=2712864 RepID=UPI0013EAD33B|nr:hypothetical protein [Aquisphaera insulae]
MSTNDERDWSGIAASFSVRCSRKGVWTSCKGTAKTSRRGMDLRNLQTSSPGPQSRRPRAWSQPSIDFSRGPTWARDDGPTAVVISTRGWPTVSTSRISSSPKPTPGDEDGRTILRDEARPSASRAVAIEAATASATESSRSVTRRISTAAPVIGSRCMWAANGSSSRS